MTMKMTPGTVRELWVTITDAKAPLPDLGDVTLAVVADGHLPGSNDWTAPASSDDSAPDRLRVAHLWTAPDQTGVYGLWLRVRGNPEMDRLRVDQLLVAAPPPPTIRRMRILIADTSPGPGEIFDDSELAEYLTLYVGDPAAATLRDVRLASADALEAMAVSEVMTSKVIRTAAGISTDGTKVSAELRARARDLRAQVERADLDEGEAVAGGGFLVLGYGRY